MATHALTHSTFFLHASAIQWDYGWLPPLGYCEDGVRYNDGPIFLSAAPLGQEFLDHKVIMYFLCGNQHTVSHSSSFILHSHQCVQGLDCLHIFMGTYCPISKEL